ncbi:TPA: mannosyltransferase [Bacillus wiedmannii]|nr:mannosyltransferase [Bacillus wiedmannii]
MTTSIPKIIHYCWFGGKEKPDHIKKYMKTWDGLKDYKIVEWNEKTFDIDNNKFVKDAYEGGKWAFVSDYVRLKVLYEHGGIYLDTDVELSKNFNDILNNDMFLGFIYDCSIGTAVIGAKPKHPLIKELLDIYEEITFCDNSYIGFTVKRFPNVKLINNNDLFTLFLLNRFKEFKLNNKYQKLDGLAIYPKNYFEVQPIFGSKYTVHWCEGSWTGKQNGKEVQKYKKLIKSLLASIPFVHLNAVVTHLQHRKKLPKLPFYKYYVEHNK